jgi:hypothetical protein
MRGRVHRTHLPFGCDLLRSELPLQVDHQRAEVNVVRVAAYVDACWRQLKASDGQARPRGAVHARLAVEDAYVLKQAELQKSTETRVRHRPTEAKARRHLRCRRHPQPADPPHDLLVPRRHAEACARPIASPTF